MAAIIRPRQQTLFSDRPKQQVTADLLDAQIFNLIEAIHSTQIALEDIRRDDGKLKNSSVGREQLTTELKHSRQEIDSVEQRTLASAQNAINAAVDISKTYRDVDLRVRDAENAAIVTASMLTAISHGNMAAKEATDDAENSADRAESAAIQSQNSANYSSANADNAIAAKNEATQWAEYLAGPVVNSADAPAYISGHPFGHGLYYQPVEGAGGTGGLWSAKWWAVYCQQLVGNVSFYYLGPSDVPLVPGGFNPVTGMPVPNPIAVGSFYYDTVTNSIMVWNGTSWQAPGVQVAAGYLASYIYHATAAQTVFYGPDINGNAPVVTDETSDVHVDGVRLEPVVDYTVDADTDALTLAAAPATGAVVQWDLLVPPDRVGAKKLNAYKLDPLFPNGVATSFNLTYIDPADGNTYAANVGTGAQLQVSLDGVIQEPNVDYTAVGDILTMAQAPAADSKLWAVWFAPGAPLGGEVLPPVDPPPVLAALTGTGDTTPNFNLTEDIVVGDVVRFQWDRVNTFNSASLAQMTNTVDATESAAMQIDFTTGPLATGAWFFRARVERGATLFPWSNITTLTI